MLINGVEVPDLAPSSAAPTPPPRTSPDVIINKYNGDNVRMAGHISDLEHDNWKVRENNRDLKAQVERLEGQVPAGGRILSKEETEELEEFRKYGKPTEVAKLKTDFENLQVEKVKSDRVAVLTNVAADLGYDSQVLVDLDEKAGQPTYKKDKITDATTGQQREDWVVQYKDGSKDKEQLVSDYYAEKFPKYLPALAQANGQAVDYSGGTVFPMQPALTPSPGSGSGSPQGQKPSVSVLSSRYGHNIPKQQ